MIIIKGENAVIEIDIIDIINDSTEYSDYENFIKCNFCYKHKDTFFKSKDIWIYGYELEALYLNLKELTKNNIQNYKFAPDRSIISIDFLRDQNSSDYLLHLKFYLEWESDTLLQSKLRLSEEQLKEFIQEIHYVLLSFKEN